MTPFEDQLKKLAGVNVLFHEPLSKHLVFRVGGPAKWFARVETEEGLVSILRLCEQHNVAWLVLGGGSNALASDEGFDGLVIKIVASNVAVDGMRVIAQAGAPSALVARKAADAGLTGLEWMASLPGTIGGAVRGNAGCFGGETKDYLARVKVMREYEVRTIPVHELTFGYRSSTFKESGNADIILEATFELPKDDPLSIKERMSVVLDKRNRTQPVASGTAGCTFKNYKIHDAKEKARLEKTDIPKEMLESGKVSAGWLIDVVGLKGTAVGNARISDSHANFIVNEGNATADEIVQLISLAKAKVRDTYGIQLEEEIQYIGF